MKKLQDEASAPQNDLVSMEVYIKKVGNEERNAHQYASSFFGPCCTNGCQYCRPNCHEQFESSSNYF